MQHIVYQSTKPGVLGLTSSAGIPVQATSPMLLPFYFFFNVCQNKSPFVLEQLSSVIVFIGHLYVMI